MGIMQGGLSGFWIGRAVHQPARAKIGRKVGNQPATFSLPRWKLCMSALQPTHLTCSHRGFFFPGVQLPMAGVNGPPGWRWKSP